jgi:hypothetical protein
MGGPRSQGLPDAPCKLSVNVVVDDFPLDAGWAAKGGRSRRIRQGGGRALRLEGSETWVPFSFTNTQRVGSSSQHSAGERHGAQQAMP